MNVYVIIEQQGCGVVESPHQEFFTPFIFSKKEDALKKSKELFMENTTESDRKSGWCGLHYIVKEITVK